MIILASKSSRRQEILSRFLKFEVISYEIEENNLYYSSPEQLVMALSFEKGIEVAKDYKNDIVISADTIVSIESCVLGKPLDREDAFEMIRKLSGIEHEVLTGYSLFNLSKNIKYTDYAVSKVKFKNLSDNQINEYLDTNEYVDKAGAYGIQGYGSVLVDYIIGDFDNIVGFPISKIADDLSRLFGISVLKEVIHNGEET
ncbi:nucleoside triphosphate pyrophosphatase [Peptoniphilus sp. oral taxon 386]|uniref:Maf family protein n=1 Tax=Peptoniphilus sp. oral taxon 386 TaxID=652713 RepID=UPI0001DA9ADE|nr:Maf family protein [Peptoniphilus sp. oral taxon 386]EFI42040.1 septum formation protein Maf [Peptoniphilus sp. oral taxon 386 str. F0131]